MSDVRIDFMIYEEYPLTQGCADGAQGGVRIVVDGLIITRFEPPGRDEGFRGDFIYSLLSDWLRAIPKMLSRVPHHSELLDEPSAFEFIPRDDGRTYVRFIYLSSYDPRNYRFYDDLRDIVSPTEEKWNKEYPNYPTGTPVDTVDLVTAILDVGERFYADIASRTFVCGTGPDAPGVPEFRETLDTAKEYVKNHVVNHQHVRPRSRGVHLPEGLINKHVLGTERGKPGMRVTFFPLGHEVRPGIVTPNAMTLEELGQLVDDSMRFGNKMRYYGEWFYIHHPNAYGIDEMRTVTKPTGEFKSSYPKEGPNVVEYWEPEGREV